MFQNKGNQTKLTPKKLDEELKYFRKQIQLSHSARDLFIDLSKLEWANTASLVELILRMENLLLEEFRITLALPNLQPLTKEKKHFNEDTEIGRSVRWAVRQRAKTRRWLHKLKIIEAMSFPNLSPLLRQNLQILDIYDHEAFREDFSGQNSAYYKIYTGGDPKYEYKDYEFFVPLLWTKGSEEELADIKKKLSGANLSDEDKENICDVVILELTKNVKEHSGKERGLFCVGVIPVNTEKIFETDYYDSETGFLLAEDENEKILKKNERIIEIVFGDSGKGLITTLSEDESLKEKSPAEIIQIAFDKWSTKTPYDDDKNSYLNRGTRGLYHVRRIMIKYDGMAGIRTGHSFAGFNDLVNESIDEKKILPEFQGTLLTVRLLPDRAKKVNTKYYPSSSENENRSSAFKKFEFDLDNYNAEIKRIGKDSVIYSTVNFLVSLRVSKWKNGPGIKKHYAELLRKLFIDLSNLRHPNVHIVYGILPMYSENEIETIVNDTNQLLTEKPGALSLNEQEEIHFYYDPIMILSPRANVYWVSKDAEVVSSLFNSLQTNKGIDLNVFSEEDISKVQLVKSDYELFEFSNGRIRLKFDPGAPINNFKQTIKKQIDDAITNKLTVSPNLGLLKGWFPLKDLYKNCASEYIFSLYSLWIKNRKKIFEKSFQNNPVDDSQEKLDQFQEEHLSKKLKVLVENEIDKPLGEMFLQMLGVKETKNNLKILVDEFDNKKPRRTSLFEKSDYVIIISSALLTGETAINLIKSVLRSNATPIVLLSMLDLSGSYNESLENTREVWGMPVPHFSIFTDKRLVAEPGNYETITFIKPTDHKKEPAKNTNAQLDRSYHIELVFREMILHSRSLYFSHIGKPNGRHFTFYFNAHRFLDNVGEQRIELIWEKFSPVIKEWFKSIGKNLDDLVEKDPPELAEKKREEIKENVSTWYPDKEYQKGYQGQGIDLSNIIRDQLWKLYRVELPDAESTSREEIGRMENREQEKNKIIIDWGSITGESVEKLIYKANKQGYKNILVCIFINQLDGKKKNYLSGITEITTYRTYIPKSPDLQQGNLFSAVEKTARGQSDGRSETTEAFKSTVTVRFIQDFPLTCYESDYECNICALIKDIGDYSIPGKVLEDYTRKRKDILYIRPRETTNEDPPFDFYDDITTGEKIPLNEEFILRMFEFKTLLAKSQSSTYWRFQLKKELVFILKGLIANYKNSLKEIVPDEEKNIWEKIYSDSQAVVKNYEDWFPPITTANASVEYDISDLSSRTHAMIYFLSVEYSWMQRPPLYLHEIREMLLLVSKAVIFNPLLKIAIPGDEDKKNIDVVRIKYAAVSLLRMADKNEFIQNIAAILENCEYRDKGSDSIIENILFHINTFVSKEYHYKHSELENLENALTAIEDKFLDNKKYNRYLRDGLWHLKLLTGNLRMKGEFKDLNYAQIVKNCLEAYNGTFLKYHHSLLLTNFNKLSFSFSGPLRPAELDIFDSRINNLHKIWGYVSDTINNLYILTLKYLSSIRASDWAERNSERLGIHYLNRFVDFGISQFSGLIKKIKDNRINLTDRKFMEEYNRQLSLINDFFILRPDTNKQEKTAKVIYFLNSIRSSYNKAFEDEKLENTILTIDNKVEVSRYLFYPQEELNFLLSHMFENCVNHKDPHITKPELTITGIPENYFYALNFTSHGTISEIYDESDLDKDQYNQRGLKRIKLSVESFQGEFKLKKTQHGIEATIKLLYI